MSLSGLLSGPIYSGGATSSTEVPGKWDVAINGRTYMIDWRYAAKEGLSRSSITLLKPQQDTGKFGEQSLNPEDFPRAVAESWHHGAGQKVLDRSDSDPYRFNTSKGADVWTRWEVSGLNDTTLFSSTSGTNLYLAPTSTRLFWLDGAAIKYDDDLTGTPSTMTGTKNWTSITSDGYYVTATDGSDVYQWTRADTSVGSAWNTLDCTLVQWVKGRLMAANGSSIYNITSSTAPTAITVATGTISTDFEWVGFAAGQSCIYAAGYQGDKSLIFRIGIKSDASGLDVAVQAGELPDGEIVRSIRAYLGYILIGTDNGWRFATASSSGDLTLGALVETDSAVRCFEGQGSSVWYGLSNYDSTSTGLGRMSLTSFNETAPAYASDLMATGQGAVLDVCTFLGKRVFTVSGLGVYVESDSKVSSWSLDNGLMTFNLPDPKVAVTVIVNHEPLAGTVTPAIATDSGVFVTLAANSETGSVKLVAPAGQRRGDVHELRLTGTGDATVTRLTLEANPAPGRGEYIYLPLDLRESVTTATGPETMDPAAEFDALISIVQAAKSVPVQTAAKSIIGFLDDYQFLPEDPTSDREWYQGTFVVKVRRPRQRST